MAIRLKEKKSLIKIKEIQPKIKIIEAENKNASGNGNNEGNLEEKADEAFSSFPSQAAAEASAPISSVQSLSEIVPQEIPGEIPGEESKRRENRFFSEEAPVQQRQDIQEKPYQETYRELMRKYDVSPSRITENPNEIKSSLAERRQNFGFFSELDQIQGRRREVKETYDPGEAKLSDARMKRRNPWEG